MPFYILSDAFRLHRSIFKIGITNNDNIETLLTRYRTYIEDPILLAFINPFPGVSITDVETNIKELLIDNRMKNGMKTLSEWIRIPWETLVLIVKAELIGIKIPTIHNSHLEMDENFDQTLGELLLIPEQFKDIKIKSAINVTEWEPTISGVELLCFNRNQELKNIKQEEILVKIKTTQPITPPIPTLPARSTTITQPTPALPRPTTPPITPTITPTITPPIQGIQTETNNEIKPRHLQSRQISQTQDNIDKIFLTACSQGRENIVQMMIEKGANNFDDGLHLACSKGHETIARLMIEKGAKINTVLFSSACLRGRENIVRLMIEKGANNFDMGLQCALKHGHGNIVKLIIRNIGADVMISKIEKSVYFFTRDQYCGILASYRKYLPNHNRMNSSNLAKEVIELLKPLQ